MHTRTLLTRNLTWYWRTNAAVIAGVATTVGVLAGALVVGDSVRASLRELFLSRLGRTSYAIAANDFFRAALADDLGRSLRDGSATTPASSPGTVALIALEGSVTHERSGRRVSRAQVFAVDERFWAFHGRPMENAPQGREALLSPALARELEAKVGDAILVRVERPSDVPVDSLHGRKDDLGRTMRLAMRQVLPREAMGEFSVRPQQGDVQAVFVPLARVQVDLNQQGRANTLLVAEPRAAAAETPSGDVADALRRAYTLEDLKLRIQPMERPRGLSVESDKILVEDRIAEAVQVAAQKHEWRVVPIFTYLATTIRAGDRAIPYSLVSGMPVSSIEPMAGERQQPSIVGSDDPVAPIWLNSWAATDLGVRRGDTLTLEYLVWEEEGRLRTESAEFRMVGTIPIATVAADPRLAPEFTGITESPDMSDWNPPFPVDLKRVRPRDEDYWHRYRTAPKAFLPLENAQKLWGTRFGRATAMRVIIPPGVSANQAQEILGADLRGQLDPATTGFTVFAVRAEGAEASRGAVNFGEYFVYFSFFLVVSAVLLTTLFFKLGIEQRLREIGLLQAVGFPRARITRLFLAEGALLAVVGSLAGLLAALVYADVIMYGLRTWWVGAVGTTLLRLHVTPMSLVLGGGGGIGAALVAIHWTLRRLRAISPRDLLGGSPAAVAAPRYSARAAAYLGFAALLAGVFLLVGAAFGWVSQVGGFFVSGSLLLMAMVSLQWAWLVRPKHALGATGLSGLTQLGIRNASWRPGRSLLCIALIASATFVIVAVDSFRRDETSGSLAADSGTGGYPLLAESLLPVPYDLNTSEGKRGLNLSDADISSLAGAKFVPFRLRPGEDASCLNLYQPRRPRILGATAEFLHGGRFAFQSSLATSPEEERNPWLLLEKEIADGAVPAIVDANTATYVLHLRLGEGFVLRSGGTRPIHLRLVATLSDSIFQREMIIAEKQFLKLFPSQAGYGFFLIETPQGQAEPVGATLERGLSDYGFDVVKSVEQLAAFHRVENTYLATFQALGGLGLLLGTVGLAAVLLRNILERRRELALLRAVGYRAADLGLVVVAENSVLLFGGLLSGLLSAILAIMPALMSRGVAVPVVSLAPLLLAVLLAGLAVSWLAVATLVRAPLLGALRTE